MIRWTQADSVLRVLCLVHNLVTCAAVLGRRGRQVVLRGSTTQAWLGRFQQALVRLLPA